MYNPFFHCHVCYTVHVRCVFKVLLCLSSVYCHHRRISAIQSLKVVNVSSSLQNTTRNGVTKLLTAQMLGHPSVLPQCSFSHIHDYTSVSRAVCWMKTERLPLRCSSFKCLRHSEASFIYDSLAYDLVQKPTRGGKQRQRKTDIFLWCSRRKGG